MDSDCSDGGTIVKLPPPPIQPVTPTEAILGSSSSSSSSSATNAAGSRANPNKTDSQEAAFSVDDSVAKRIAKIEDRKRELLLEARNARVEWILNNGIDDSDDERSNPSTNGELLLSRLEACRPDALPCIPQVIETMISSAATSHNVSQPNQLLHSLLEKHNLSWESVSNHISLTKKEDPPLPPMLDPAALPIAMPSPQSYTVFLDTMCEPSAANLVMSIQKFCGTIREATHVMVSSLKDAQDAVGSGDTNDETPRAIEGKSNSNLVKTTVSSPSTHSAGSSLSKHQQHQAQMAKHMASLARAIRGFIKTTSREIEEHGSFQAYSENPAVKVTGEHNLTMGNDAAIRENLLASLETFVYSKCRHDIDMVLLEWKEVPCKYSSSSTIKSLKESQVEWQEKMQSLQFVTPAHLEIACMNKSSSADPKKDIELSYAISQLKSISRNHSSPRQILRSILLAHRGVSGALNDACGDGVIPGADDMLPALILATLRAHPSQLLVTLRFVQHFLHPSLLQGEAAYAYTNLCGAVEFLRELDCTSHLKEVTLGGLGEGASLLISPEDFRAGLEECREVMKKKKVERQEPGGSRAQGNTDGNKSDTNEVDTPLKFKITAQQVREARSKGESVDLSWAIQKQNESMWQEGRIKDILLQPTLPKEATKPVKDRPHPEQQHVIPPESLPLLPSQFSRSYSFLDAQPENIGVCDLPRLLKEYRMLVHVTEKLLDERIMWRENERKRQLQLERGHLERDFQNVIGEADD